MTRRTFPFLLLQRRSILLPIHLPQVIRVGILFRAQTAVFGLHRVFLGTQIIILTQCPVTTIKLKIRGRPLTTTLEDTEVIQVPLVMEVKLIIIPITMEDIRILTMMEVKLIIIPIIMEDIRTVTMMEVKLNKWRFQETLMAIMETSCLGITIVS